MGNMAVTRRQLVTLGAAGAAGAVLGRGAIRDEALAASKGHGGLHIYVVTYVVRPEELAEFKLVHTFIATLWGPDSALSGMGCGFSDGTTSTDPVRRVTTGPLGTGLVGCVFSAEAKLEAGVVKGFGIMVYSGSPDEKMGQRFPFEAHLSTGFCRFTDMNMDTLTGVELTAITTEGTGSVTRI